MRDIDVRRVMARKVLREHESEPDTLVIHELGLMGGITRVDVAVINGRIHGYEIKSERDKLDRLLEQANTYNKIFDNVTLVCGERHLDAGLRQVPFWWGVKCATTGARGAVHLHQVRRPKRNNDLDPRAIAALLWRNEALDVLSRWGADQGVRSKSKAALFDRLAATLPLKELRGEVRRALKIRENWRDR